jgi:hypothetical protein
VTGAPAVWHNRIVDYGEEAPEQLLANPWNARRHDGYQSDIMIGALEELGWISDVIVNRRTGHVVDGHLRVTVAMRTGQKAVPVKYVELSAEEEQLVLATLDQTTALAIASPQAFEELVGSIPNLDDDALQEFLDRLAEKGGNVGKDRVMGDDASSSTPIAAMRFGHHEVLISREERQLALDLLTTYEADCGTTGGFVSHVLSFQQR